MKRNIAACILIALCLVIMLASVRQAEARSTNPSHIPFVTLYIRQNKTTKHNYFDPTFPCIRGRTAYVTIRNTTKQAQAILWDTTQKSVTIRSEGSITSIQHAIDKGVDNPNFEIDVILNPDYAQYTQEAVAFISADGVVSRCIG